jgi:hypothetical protein
MSLFGWRVPLAAWALSRALVIGVAVAAALWLGLPTRGVDPAVPHALAFLGGWDTTWYLDIARHGYAHDAGQVGSVFTNLAFFPLLPGIMAAFLAVGINPFVGALVVANLAFLGALAAFGALTARRQDATAATRAVWTLALLPTAVYCSLAYTESIALACAVAGALAAVRGRYLLAGMVVAVGSLSRPTGILVVVLIGLLALQSSPVLALRLRRTAAAAAPSVLAVGAFLGWMAVERGSALLPFEAQRAWDRGQLGVGLVSAAPGEVRAGWGHLVNGTGGAAWHATIRDLLVLVVALALLAMLWRAEGLRSPWVVYSLVVLAVPLSSGTLTSMARFSLMAFPLLWPLADWLGRDRRRVQAGVAVAVAGIVLAVLQLLMRSP